MVEICKCLLMLKVAVLSLNFSLNPLVYQYMYDFVNLPSADK